jgi:HEAT repeat protein
MYYAQKASATAASRKAVEDESKLIEVLKKPDASRKDKADALRVLGRVGTRECVPVVAPLLGDDDFSHMARYALEPIPDPAVDVALREAAGKVSGRNLVGVIGSLGVRRDPKAVAVLAPRLLDAEAGVGQAAARALGFIGTVEASQALEAALPKLEEADRAAAFDGLLRCAEALAVQGQCGCATSIYEGVSKAKAPECIREGATRAAEDLRKG